MGFSVNNGSKGNASAPRAGGGGMTNNARAAVHTQAGAASRVTRASHAAPIVGQRGSAKTTNPGRTANQWAANHTHRNASR